MKKLSLILAVLLLFVSAAGCSGDGTGTLGGDTQPTAGAPSDTTDGTQAGDTAPTTASGDKPDTITIATQQDFVLLDPFNTTATPDYNVNWCIFDSLINMDVEGNIYPLVARDWAFNDEGTEITFYIRDDITFHDGSALTARDVVYSAMKMKESTYKTRVAALYTDAEVIDDYTMKFNLPQPAASFLYELAYNFAVYSEAATEAAGDSFKDHPIGCGAYAFVSKRSGEGVVLKAYDGYYGGKADIENLIFRVIPDASTALVSLENGEIDLCEYVPAASYPLVMSNDRLDLLQTQFSRVLNLILNVEQEPFAGNATLRQAIAHAIDKQFLIDVALEGYGTVAYALVNDSFIAAPKNIKDHDREYNVEKARELLAEAGYPDGEGLPTLKLTTIEMFKKQAELIQSMLKEINIEISIDMVELSTFISMSSNGELQIGMMSSNQGGDASVMAALLLSTSINSASYGNPEVDALFSKASAILDNDERSKVFDELFALVLDDMPYVSIYFPDTVSCGRADLDFASIMRYVAYKGMYYSYK